MNATASAAAGSCDRRSFSHRWNASSHGRMTMIEIANVPRKSANEAITDRHDSEPRFRIGLASRISVFAITVTGL
jgi:hypothetical protein